MPEVNKSNEDMRFSGENAVERELEALRFARVSVDSMLDPYVALRAVRGTDGSIVDFVFSDANPAACEFYRLPDEELIGTRLLEHYPAVENELLARYFAVVETGEPLELHGWIHQQDLEGGATQVFDIRAVKVGDGLVQTSRDVTERWSKEQASLIRAAEAEREVSRLAAELVIVGESQTADSHASDRAILDSFLDPHVLLTALRDEAGTIIGFFYAEANQAACDYLGVSVEELIGSKLLERFPGQVTSGLFDAYVAAADDGVPIELDAVVMPSEVHEGLRRFDVRGRASASGVSLTWRDVTEREASAGALAASEARYRLLAENASDVVALGTSEGRLEWLSESVLEVLGWAPNQLVGRHFAEIVHPDDLLKVVVVQQQLSAGVRGSMTIRLATAVGGWRWMAIIARPLFDDDGRITGRVAGWRNVEEQVQVWNALEESERRYRLLAENASDVVAAASADGRITWLSESVTDLLGWSPDDLIGARISDLIHPEDLETLAVIQSQMVQGAPRGGVARLRTADEGWRWIESVVRPVLDDEGLVVGRVAAWRDAEESVRTKKALEESEARYRFLIENASDVQFWALADTTIEWVSPSVVELTGLAPEDIIGRSAIEFAVSEDHEALQRAIHDVLAGQPTTHRDRIVAADGSTRRVSVTLRPTFDEHGEVNGCVGAIRNIEDLSLALENLEQQRSRATATLDTILDPHVVLTAVRNQSGAIVDFVYTEANDAACAYNRTPRDELVGMSMMSILPAHDSTGLLDMYRHVVETGEPLILDDFQYPHEILADTRYFDIRAAKLGDAISYTWRDVTERRERLIDANERASHDPLTGLANRLAILDELERGLNSAARTGRPLAVLLVDLDRFKNVNDSLGHPVGDRLLVAAARRLEHAVRSGDLVGRLGGDEFVVVMRDLNDGTEAATAAGRIVQAFREPHRSEGGIEFYTTASVGIAVTDAEAATVTADDLLREADTALYLAKNEGRDRASMFNDDLRQRVMQRLTIEAELRPALAAGDLELWYQPEIDLTTGEVVAVEALLRWRHPSGEFYAADRFIDVAEETGLILEIGAWVLAQACHQAAAWSSAYPAHPITVRFNLSALQLAEAGLLAALDTALADSGVDPTRLCVEITETAFLNETATVLDNLESIRARGLQIALDDFGTGYASLAYLRDFPIQIIKIDRGFTAALLTDTHNQSLVAGIIALAETLDIAITAEGIETPMQAEILAELGCTSGQGYLYSRALPAAEVEKLFDHTFGH